MNFSHLFECVGVLFDVQFLAASEIDGVVDLLALFQYGSEDGLELVEVVAPVDEIISVCTGPKQPCQALWLHQTLRRL